MNTATLLLAAALLPPQQESESQPPDALVTSFAQTMVGPVPAALGLDPFYRKHADAFGIPIVASAKVPSPLFMKK